MNQQRVVGGFSPPGSKLAWHTCSREHPSHPSPDSIVARTDFSRHRVPAISPPASLGRDTCSCYSNVCCPQPPTRLFIQDTAAAPKLPELTPALRGEVLLGSKYPEVPTASNRPRSTSLPGTGRHPKPPRWRREIPRDLRLEAEELLRAQKQQFHRSGAEAVRAGETPRRKDWVFRRKEASGRCCFQSYPANHTAEH